MIEDLRFLTGFRKVFFEDLVLPNFSKGDPLVCVDRKHLFEKILDFISAVFFYLLLGLHYGLSVGEISGLLFQFLSFFFQIPIGIDVSVKILIRKGCSWLSM